MIHRYVAAPLQQVLDICTSVDASSGLNEVSEPRVAGSRVGNQSMRPIKIKSAVFFT